MFCDKGTKCISVIHYNKEVDTKLWIHKVNSVKLLTGSRVRMVLLFKKKKDTDSNKISIHVSVHKGVQFCPILSKDRLDVEKSPDKKIRRKNSTAKNFDPCQPAQSAQADMNRYFLQTH